MPEWVRRAYRGGISVNRRIYGKNWLSTEAHVGKQEWYLVSTSIAPKPEMSSGSLVYIRNSVTCRGANELLSANEVSARLLRRRINQLDGRLDGLTGLHYRLMPSTILRASATIVSVGLTATGPGNIDASIT